MAFARLCSDDPVVSELRAIFKANILRVPEERIAPLSVLCSSRDEVRFLGTVGSLLDGTPFEQPIADFKESEMASLVNRRSRSVDAEIALQVLSGFLDGMGGTLSPKLSSKLREKRTLRFHFPSVRRRYVEIARIGQLLAGRAFDRSNLLSETLLDPRTSVRLIDSVITSSEFEIETGDGGEAGLELDAGLLKQLLMEAKVDVVAKDANRLAFRSRRRMTFAFTCVNVGLLSTGVIRAIAPSAGRVGPPQLPASTFVDQGLEAHVLLTREPELIELSPDR